MGTERAKEREMKLIISHFHNALRTTFTLP